jgi:hypothetical protein
MTLPHNTTNNGDIDLSNEFDISGEHRISDIINEFVNISEKELTIASLLALSV